MDAGPPVVLRVRNRRRLRCRVARVMRAAQLFAFFYRHAAAAVLIDGPARFAYHARVNNRRSQVVSQGRYSNGDRRGVVRAA